MTPVQRQFWTLAHSRIARLRPDMVAAALAMFRIVGAGLNERELVDAIAAGALDVIVTRILSDALLERASLPLRRQIRETIEESFRFNTRYLPRAGKVNGTLAVFFDRLNPRVIEAVRTLETNVVGGMNESMRATVLQAVERGLVERRAPRTIARGIREVIGLSPRGEEAVANFRKMLETGDREALTRLLRDRRFDRTLDRALGKGGTGLTSAQIESMVAANRRKAIALNANTVASTAVKDAYKIATRESWASAIDRGIVDGDRLMRQYIGVDDERERDKHRALNNQIVRFDQPYSSGQMYAGEGDYNCRCIDRYFIARAA